MNLQNTMLFWWSKVLFMKPFISVFLQPSLIYHFLYEESVWSIYDLYVSCISLWYYYNMNKLFYLILFTPFPIFPNILLWSWLCQAKREALNSFLQDDYLPCMGLSWKGRNTKLGTISRREGVDISTDPLMTMHVGAPKIFCTWQIPRQRNVIIVGMIMMGVKMVFFFFFCKGTK